MREVADEGPGHTLATGNALDLRRRLLDAPVGHEEDGAEAAGLVGAILDEPVVVGLHHGQVQVGILGTDHELRDARRGVEHRRIDQVLIHLGEAGGGVVAAGAESRRTAPTDTGPERRWAPAALSPKLIGSLTPSITQASPCSKCSTWGTRSTNCRGDTAPPRGRAAR